MRCDPHTALIDRLLARGGSGCRLVASSEQAWASITFEGARHVIELEIPAGVLASFLPGIEETEFELPGHLVADMAVTDRLPGSGGLSAIRLEALTLLDR